MPGKICAIEIQSDYESPAKPNLSFCRPLDRPLAKTIDYIQNMEDEIFKVLYAIIGFIIALVGKMLMESKSH